jgi:hypothetical protein
MEVSGQLQVVELLVICFVCPDRRRRHHHHHHHHHQLRALELLACSGFKSIKSFHLLAERPRSLVLVGQ